MLKKSNFLLISILFSGVVFMSVVGCGGIGGKNENTDSTDVDTTVVETGDLSPGMTPFNFPAVDISAQSGDLVLCPGYKMWQNSLKEEDPTNETYFFYTSKIAQTGDVESYIEFFSDSTQKMPNSMLIPIPKGQTVSNGDIVLTWWQTHSGIQRAIVTDASDPAMPFVRYLDISYNNPATDEESGNSIGQTDYQLKANSFVKITDAWQPGNLIAAKDDGSWVSTQIIRVSGDKVLTFGFAGKITVYNKADCKPVPIVPDVKKGETVWAVFVSSFGEYEVVRVEKEIGRVFVIQFDEEVAIPYGQITVDLE